MPLRHCIAIFMTIIGAAFFASASANELEDREAIYNQVDSDFFNGKFTIIETQAKSYLDTQERTTSGLWRLTILHASFERIMASSNSLSTKQEILKTWAKAYPASATVRFAEVQLLMARAKSIRGLSGKYELDPEVVEPYQRLLRRASDRMEADKALTGTDPRWYSLMFDIARLQRWNREDFYKLALEAFEKHPLYYQNYFDAIEFITSQDNWTANEVEDFVNAAVKRTRKHENMGMYARIYWSASQSYYRNYIFEQSLVSWPKMKQGFDDIMKKYPDDWNLNNYAKFSCLAKDAETTRALFQKIGSSFMPQVWSKKLRTECEEMIYPKKEKTLV